MKKKTLSSLLRWLGVNLCRLLLSVVFLFSGMAKLNDPLGTQYKIEDYASAMGLGSLLPAPLPLCASVLLGAVEFCLGVYLFFSIHRRRTLWLVLALLLFFTPLTLWTAIANPVSDCGCFGDALVLTNWQTFWKNVVLLAAWYVAWRYRCRMTRFITERNQWLVSLYSWTFAFAFALLNLHGLPLIDFRPYHIGADIREKMSLGDEAAQYETTFLLEKNGVTKEFTLDDYPDSTWNFVDSRTTLKHAGAELPEIHDLVITSIDENREVTDELLADSGWKFVLVSPHLTAADDGVMDHIAAIHDYCQEYGYAFLGLTASGDEDIERWRDATGAEYPFYRVDAIPLKTMVRSNPGLLLLKGSVVANKWPSTKLPREEQLTAPLDELPLAHPQLRGFLQRVLRIVLWYVLPLLVLTLADRLWVQWKLRKLHTFSNHNN